MHYLIRALCWRLLTRRWRILLTIFFIITACFVLVQVSMVLEYYSSSHTDDFLPEFEFIINRTGPFAGTMSYCNFPPNVAPVKLQSDDELHQVHIFTRHGIRTPIHEADGNSLELTYNCSLSAFHSLANEKNLQINILSSLYTEDLLSQTSSKPLNKLNNFTSCGQGVLLPRGVVQMYLLGRSLGSVYNKVSQNSAQVELRSTDFSRTRMSLKAFFLGFRETLTKLNIDNSLNETPPVEAFQSLAFCDKRNTEASDCFCPQLRTYYAEILRVKSQLVKRHSATHAKLLTELWGKKYLDLNANGDSEDTPSWLRWTASDLVDQLWPTICSLQPKNDGKIKSNDKFCFSRENLSKSNHCVSVDLLETIINLHHTVEKQLTKHQSFIRYSKVAMHPFLKNLVHQLNKEEAIKSRTQFTHQVNNNSDYNQQEQKQVELTSFALYSGHDHTLRILLTALDAYDGQWPAFASHIRWEWFYRKLQSGQTKYVLLFRLLRDSNDITDLLPFCKSEYQQYAACSFTALQNFLQTAYWSLFQSNNFNRECS